MVNTEDPRRKIQIHDEAAKPIPHIHIFIQRSWRKATKVPSQSSQSASQLVPPPGPAGRVRVGVSPELQLGGAVRRASPGRL